MLDGLRMPEVEIHVVYTVPHVPKYESKNCRTWGSG